MLANLVVGGVLALVLFWAFKRSRNDMKSNKCSGCSGCDSKKEKK